MARTSFCIHKSGGWTAWHRLVRDSTALFHIIHFRYSVSGSTNGVACASTKSNGQGR
ncbi:hypothetical protein PIB30_080613, partial [Stylosanthes scabra]|nr:hypothetical protein [Stylosanthes scabra]